MEQLMILLGLCCFAGAIGGLLASMACRPWFRQMRQDFQKQAEQTLVHLRDNASSSARRSQTPSSTVHTRPSRTYASSRSPLPRVNAFGELED